MWTDVQRHLPRVWRAVRAYERDPGTQEDLVQEVLLAVWQGLPRLRDPARLPAYMLRIAHNLGASHVRHAVRTPDRSFLDPQAMESIADASSDPNDADTQWLLDALRLIPLPQRQVLLLQLEGFDYKEIAEMLGISTENVGVRAHRARKALQEIHDGHQ
ncbi:sigma-70 family RNA polymerase sigma factor [Bacillus subtilis subsp. subtilis]|nr:sigma-70 family RNA polymerase sigma factor [Bacillus subtilis subsp. subtilis]